MDALWQIELTILQTIQAAGHWLLAPALAFSFLGTENFFLIIIPLLYWCINPGLGLRIGTMLIATSALNGYFKQFFHFPRPYWLSDKVQALSSETSFGMPSGHAQNAASMWGIAVVSLRQRYKMPTWFSWLAVLAVVGVGLSRLYLGMHFISDVVAGWLIGIGLIWAFVKLEKPTLAWYLKMDFPRQALWIFFSSVLLIALNLWIISLSSGWRIPEIWLQNAAAATPGVTLAPFSIAGCFTSAGTWLGLAIGATWLYRQGGMDTRGSMGQKVVRYLLGMLGIFIIWFGLGQLFPHGEDALSLILRYLRYALLGGWVAIGGPLLFMKLHLVQPRPTD